MKKRFALAVVPIASVLLCMVSSTPQSYQAAQASAAEQGSGTISKSVQTQGLKLASLDSMPSWLPIMPTTKSSKNTPIAKPLILSHPAQRKSNDTPSLAGPSSPSRATAKTQSAGPQPAAETKKKKAKKVKKTKKKSRIITTAAVLPLTKDGKEVKCVALTFDDGPNPVYTPQVLALLKKEGIHATFCLIGRHAKKYPELVQQIVAEGNKIADHSMNHDEHLDRRSLGKIKEEILGTKALLESIVPGTTIEYYRAPGGNMNERLQELVSSWGMKPLGWSVDPKDWQRPGTDNIIATVKSQLKPGCVIIMHDAGGDRTDTIEALAKVIPQLKKAGYQFVFPG